MLMLNYHFRKYSLNILLNTNNKRKIHSNDLMKFIIANICLKENLAVDICEIICEIQ